jgi:hypothetical protein
MIGSCARSTRQLGSHAAPLPGLGDDHSEVRARQSVAWTIPRPKHGFRRSQTAESRHARRLAREKALYRKQHPGPLRRVVLRFRRLI